MECPLLEEQNILLCKGNEEPYVPSVNELNFYCRSGSYKRCIFYCERDCPANGTIWKKGRPPLS